MSLTQDTLNYKINKYTLKLQDGNYDIYHRKLHRYRSMRSQSGGDPKLSESSEEVKKQPKDIIQDALSSASSTMSGLVGNIRKKLGHTGPDETPDTPVTESDKQKSLEDTDSVSLDTLGASTSGPVDKRTIKAIAVTTTESVEDTASQGGPVDTETVNALKEQLRKLQQKVKNVMIKIANAPK